MALDPEDSMFFYNIKFKELEEEEENLNDFKINVGKMETKRNEERYKKIKDIRSEASQAFKSTQVVRNTLDAEFKLKRKQREKELVQRAAEERQKTEDRELDWERYQAREIKSSELRQQYLDRDSHRDRLERQDKVDKYKDVLDYKTTYDNSLTHNRMILMEKEKTSRLQITDAETRKYKAIGDAQREALMAADAQRSSNEVNLASWKSCERTVNKAIENGVSTRKKGNSIVFF